MKPSHPLVGQLLGRNRPGAIEPPPVQLPRNTTRPHVRSHRTCQFRQIEIQLQRTRSLYGRVDDAVVGCCIDRECGLHQAKDVLWYDLQFEHCGNSHRYF